MVLLLEAETLSTRKLALLAVILAVVGGLAGTANGSTTYAGGFSISVSVLPIAPTEADAVTIEVTGSLPTPCHEVSSSHVITGNSILVTVNIVPVGEFCIQVLASFSVSEEVGQLIIGSYFVQTIVHSPCCFPCPPTCVETTTFDVTPKAPSDDTDGDNIPNFSDPNDDNDACTDDQENGPDETLGGRRNPHNKWDFYDTNGDAIIDLPNDILGVVQHYAPLGTEPAYDVNFDRGPSAGPNVWNMTAPDGVIDLPNDILGVIQQYLHSCQ